jgi:serine/threonine protein phosphatase 1
LRRLHTLIEHDAAAHAGRRKAIVYLGDYIDRGPDSRAVIDLLLDEPLGGFERIFLRGNHEDSLLRFLDDSEIGQGWLAYGGDSTVRSYGVRLPEVAALAAVQRMLAESLPPRHIAFLRAAHLYHVEGDYAFVHAGFRPGLALDAQAEEDMLWIREEFLLSRADFGKIVVHGHNITNTPDVRRNRIGIDTGAFATGTLTCLALDGAERSFIST